MRRILAALSLCIVFATPVYGESNPLMLPPGGRPIADWISTGLVSANITLDSIETVKAWRNGDKSRLYNQICRMGVAIGTTTLVKSAVHRWRPDMSNRESFWSGHTANAAASAAPYSSSGKNFSIGVSITVGTAAGRMMAGKHYPTDVIVGALDGIAAHYLCGAVAEMHL